jgi:hypothetical protein
MRALLTKDFWETTQAVLTVAALLIGGFWTYKLYRQKRQRFPQVNISHQISHWSISPDKTLVRVKVLFANVGERLFSVAAGYVRLLQMQPLPDEIAKTIREGSDPVTDAHTEIIWPAIAKRYWPHSDHEVEPKETDEAIFEFVIGNDIQAVIVESAFENANKRRQGIKFWSERSICWNTTTVYELKNSQHLEPKERKIMSKKQIGRVEKQVPARDNVRPSNDRQGPARDSVRPPQQPTQQPPKQPSK